MTWVIGASSIFGDGAMISDVRASWPDGRTRDIVQKARHVGPCIVGGFAGSIKIGFQMLESLSRFLIPPPGAPQDGGWEPGWVAKHWQPSAIRIFANASSEEQSLNSHILLVGIASGRNKKSAKNVQNLLIPRVYLITMKSPNFKPVFFTKPLSIVHVGSGSTVLYYTEKMHELFCNEDFSMQSMAAGPALWSAVLGNSMGKLVNEHPFEGVSPHVHILVCSQGYIFEGTNNETVISPVYKKFEMPKTARSYEDFCIMCNDGGINVKGATA
jgi:hypothetical protein